MGYYYFFLFSEGLRDLERAGFGWLRTWGGRGMQLFAKTPPTMVAQKKGDTEKMGISVDSYTSNYHDDSWLEANVREIVYTEEFQRIIGNKFD